MTGAQSKRIALEAASWVVKFDGVEFKERDVARFRRWLAKSDEHRAAFERASRAWNRLDLLGKLETFPLPPARAPARPLGRREFLLAGAGGAAACGLVAYASLSASDAEAFETAIGETREVELADGTRVLMNADTKIKAHISPTQRQARLVQGEALFAIAERPAPFSIATPRGEIEVAGGEVLVKLLPSGSRITLLSDGARAQRTHWLGRSTPLLAPANSKIVFTTQTIEVSPADADQRARRTSWREGVFAFDNTALGEAAGDFARQSGVRFVFRDPALSQRRISGRLRKDDLDAFLVLLETNLAIVSTRRGDEIVLSAAGG